MSVTPYVVIVFSPDTKGWREVLRGSFRTPGDAKRAGADANGGGVYLAVPERSWTPEKFEGRQMTVWDVTAVEDPALAAA